MHFYFIISGTDIKVLTLLSLWEAMTDTNRCGGEQLMRGRTKCLPCFLTRSLGNAFGSLVMMGTSIINTTVGHMETNYEDVKGCCDLPL